MLGALLVEDGVRFRTFAPAADKIELLLEVELFQTPPAGRRDAYHKLTFSMAYFGNERYLLPLSHDEVVHGKATIAQKMAAAEVEDKLAQARVLYLYQMAHPGKKLNFMGWEIAQLREWDERCEQDWFMRKYPAHDV